MKAHNLALTLGAALLGAGLPTAATAGWGHHYAPEGISATGLFEHFGQGGTAPVDRSGQQRIKLGSIGSVQWAPRNPSPAAPAAAPQETPATQYRRAGIGGDNTP